jgi:GMP reductase
MLLEMKFRNPEKILWFLLIYSILKHKMLTAVHKHYSVEEWKEFAAENPDVLPVHNI